MKAKILLLAMAIFSITSLMAQEGKSIRVNISGINGDKGCMMVALYNTEDTFLKKPFMAKMGEIKDKKSSLIFENLPSGTYALSCFYDENSNKILDTNNMGIPKEQTGASNNAKGFMGPPKFKDAKFVITFKDIVLDIKL